MLTRATSREGAATAQEKLQHSHGCAALHIIPAAGVLKRQHGMRHG